MTHCKPSAGYLQSLYKEYLLYSQYALLTPKGIRPRLARITYIDALGRKDPYPTYAILLEHIDQVAQRLGGEETEMKLRHQDQCEMSSLDLMVMFQYMVGHTDWSASEQHNIKLIQSKTDGIIPIPYDFDYTGVIDAPYAVPDPRLEITDVKTRLFRGYCRPVGTYEKVIIVFQDKKQAMYDLFTDFELLDPKQAQIIIKYYDKFYKVVDDPKKVKTQINQACPLNHPHLYKIKIAQGKSGD